MKHDLIELFDEYTALNSLPGMPLITRVSKGWECSVCGRHWKKKPSSDCMGIRCYSYGRWPEGLMTRTQLGQAGYKNDFKSLPAAVGYYDKPKTGAVYLYDRSQAMRKKPSKRKRALTYVEEILFPVSCIAMFDRLNEAKKETKEQRSSFAARRDYVGVMRDIAETISATVFFTPDELTTIGGGFITLKVRVIAVRRVWPLAGWSDQMRLLVEAADDAFWKWRFTQSDNTKKRYIG